MRALISIARLFTEHATLARGGSGFLFSFPFLNDQTLFGPLRLYRATIMTKWAPPSFAAVISAEINLTLTRLINLERQVTTRLACSFARKCHKLAAFTSKRPLQRTLFSRTMGHCRANMFFHRNMGRRKCRSDNLMIRIVTPLAEEDDRSGRLLLKLALLDRISVPRSLSLSLSLSFSFARSLSLSLFGKTHGHSARPAVDARALCPAVSRDRSEMYLENLRIEFRISTDAWWIPAEIT